jgi:hypothetical protein
MPIRFPTTRWSLVAQAAQGSVDNSKAALADLLSRYTPPMKAYLIAGRRIRPDAADDILQGFIASRVLEQGLLGQADRNFGRFRGFLLSTLRAYVADQARHNGRAKRSATGEVLSLDSAPEPSDNSGDPRMIFDVEWARRVLSEALEQMRTQCVASGRSDLWVVFDERVVGPTLGQRPAMPYAELVARLGLGSAEQASNLLMTAKRLFRRCLRSVVRGYVADEAEVDEELADLERILSRGGSLPRGYAHGTR